MTWLNCFWHEGSTESESCGMCRAALGARRGLASHGFPPVLDGQCRCCGPNGFMQPPCQNLECHRNRRLRVLRQQARDPDRHDPPPSPDPSSPGGIDRPRIIYCIMTQEQEARLDEYERSLPGQRLDLGVPMPIPSTDSDTEGLARDRWLAWSCRQYNRQMLEWEVLQELQKIDRQELLHRQYLRELNIMNGMQTLEAEAPSISSCTNGDTGPRDRAVERLQAARWAEADPAPVVSTVDIIRFLFKSSIPESYLCLVEEYGDREVAPSSASAIQELLIRKDAGRPLNWDVRREAPVRVERPGPCNCNWNPRRRPTSTHPPTPSSSAVTTRPGSASYRWEPYPRNRPDTRDSRVVIPTCPCCGVWATDMPWPTFQGATLDNNLLYHDTATPPEVPVSDITRLLVQNLNLPMVEYVSMDLEGDVIDETFEAASEYGENHEENDMW
ncbi:uncharacterized protein BO95DRAFT_483700 [Aspergillus brunneoviolaceus CBS 621.78]|uniref:Uncharacterized protein n=1 Tax=Aspergillus brunneoviolaceus CBS 621.78 TaxID=1450534 RepID=A0ACD1G3G0_9EURO|nr:hypothetical protein BO95DRAFT_483700 [Aspergillus brunneoviolaceus CBS 621.78]RAH43814.1 hypothetical protein BO95DRAFT_483700 [Aspergillus brunneoviolaceus CBS 621.78]